MKKVIIGVIFALILILIFIVLIFPQNVQEPGFSSEVLVKNLDIPWAIDFLPDDRMIFTERVGRVSIWDGNQVKVVGNINVTHVTESGLLGIAVDPNFTENKYIYLYYTHDGVNRISRFVLNGSLKDEHVLLDNIPSSPIHNGGRIKFGPDGKLYATTGDAANSSSAQNINSLGGKILRLNPNGSIPSDNPFGNYVYSYGHRDPQGLAWNPNDGLLYESEHGATMNDEINIIKKGGNYGWPIVQGNNSASGFISPIRVYTEFTLAPSGIAFYQNDLYVAGLRGTQLRRIIFASDGRTITAEEALFTNLGRIREVVEHKGYLYISTSNRDGRGIPQLDDDKIIRLKI